MTPLITETGLDAIAVCVMDEKLIVDLMNRRVIHERETNRRVFYAFPG